MAGVTLTVVSYDVALTVEEHSDAALYEAVSEVTLEISTSPGPAGPSGGSGGSVEATVVAGETLSGHRAVTIHADGLAYYASSDNPDDVTRVVWLSLGAAIQGTPVTLQALGVVVEPSWNWTDGPIFLGAGGLLTQTPPTAPDFLMQLAAPNGATSLVFNPRSPIVL